MDPDPWLPAVRRADRPLGPSASVLEARRRIAALHPEFMELNAAVLQVCTDWQVRTVGGAAMPNDHHDAAHDRRTIARLVAVHRRALPLLDGYVEVLDRFRCYRSRLDVARRRVQAGHHDWFTRPGIDSYHTVWFELHEELRNVLGPTGGGGSPGASDPARGTLAHPQEHP